MKNRFLKILSLILPLGMMVSNFPIVSAGGVVSTLKGSGSGSKTNSYSVVDTHPSFYSTHDMSRIVASTFNYTKCGKYDDNLSGPWRFMAYARVKNDPKFDSLISQETERQLDLHNMLRELATIGTSKNFVPMTAQDPNFEYHYSWPTDNEDFEKIVEFCRREWNATHNYAEPIHNPEEALKKALRILKPAFEDKDPFCNKQTKVSYDPIKRIYQIEPISTYTICEAHAAKILLGANGDVVSIYLHGDEDLLRKLM